MKSFAEKVLDARRALNLSQTELGNKAGLSLRSILAYEKGEKLPRPGTVLKLARALDVSVKFLTDVNCENPLEDIEKDRYIESAREQYGAKGARDMETLLADNIALFAGGDISDDDKDLFFEAIAKAYFNCKKEARTKFAPKSKQIR